MVVGGSGATAAITPTNLRITFNTYSSPLREN